MLAAWALLVAAGWPDDYLVQVVTMMAVLALMPRATLPARLAGLVVGFVLSRRLPEKTIFFLLTDEDRERMRVHARWVIPAMLLAEVAGFALARRRT